MRKNIVTIILACVNLFNFAQASDIKYVDASSLPLLGKAIDDTASKCRYSRLPDSLSTQVERYRLYTLGTNSTGMAIRFRSASPKICAKWNSPWKFMLEIQSPVGTRGLDLYALNDDGKTWQFINSAQPNVWENKTETTIIANMEPKMREYIMYLSLYDTVDSLYIGVEEGYSVEPPAVDIPSTKRPIIVYGTSIVQGPGASKPSMNYTNMLTRRLNREVINLGFGGHGQLDLPVAKVIAAKKDPGMIILDFVPNCTPERIDTMMIPFFDIIRQAHPDVPVLIVEAPLHTRYVFDRQLGSDFDAKNECLRNKFLELKKRGEKSIYFLEGKKIFTPDSECTVDGLHFTDEAYRDYSNILYRIIKKYALK
ncbi:MAG: SGNH/GDSL hydrolase family protein [Muribaculaceae bacterium]|nr:SGNH/GDSL hydrolase family protein [Muribaculaceae bacterium]